LGGVHPRACQKSLYNAETWHARTVDGHVKRRALLVVCVKECPRNSVDETPQRPFEDAHLQSIVKWKIRPEARGNESSELIREITWIIPLRNQHMEWIVSIAIAGIHELFDR
jgi:hypothetical protein